MLGTTASPRTDMSTLPEAWIDLLAEAGGADDPTQSLRPSGGGGLGAAECQSVASADHEPVTAPTEMQAGLGERVLSHEAHCEAGSRFHLLASLGRGGMGEVLLAEQACLGRQVAIKVLQRRADPRALAAFRAEARVTGVLDHPNVVPVHDAGADFFVMKRVRGRTLGQVARDGASTEELTEILLKVCDALAFAHDKGLIHRDLKPGNIMVGAFGEVLVMDWGLAVCLDPAGAAAGHAPPLTTANRFAGTPSYLAPEMAAGEIARFSVATDVFLLGGTLYSLLAGRPPFQAASTADAVLKSLSCAWAPLPPATPRSLQRLIERTLDADPLRRGTVADVAHDLRAFLAHAAAGREAHAALATAQQHARRAAVTLDPVAAYTDWDAAVDHLVKAQALEPDDDTIRHEHRHTRAAYAAAAIAAEDLVLARNVLHPVADHADVSWALTRLHVAVATRAQARRRRRVLATAGVLTGLLVSAGLGALAAWEHAQMLAAQARAEQAERRLPLTPTRAPTSPDR